MSKSISIADADYKAWIQELKSRYRSGQLKAAVKVNTEVLRFYWELGHDIVEMHVEERWGQSVVKQIATDLKRELPNVSGLSISNIYYAKRFYLFYSQCYANLQQLAVNSKATSSEILQQPAVKLANTLSESPSIVEERLANDLFSIPWGHNMLILDKCSDSPDKALFYVSQTVRNGWSRAMLLNFIDSNLYERQGKALTNFDQRLPQPDSDLARELTKDPYNFAFTGITGVYNERLLKDALLNNITQFLIELGTGFAYVGKEYRLQIGETENFIDLLFYNLKLRCYVVVEVKIEKFSSADIGQLGSYVVAVNRQLREEGRDNPTIGLLICKSKDNTLAQYALESSSQPIGISEYELEKFYPEKVEGIIPTIKELEAKLDEQ